MLRVLVLVSVMVLASACTAGPDVRAQLPSPAASTSPSPEPTAAPQPSADPTPEPSPSPEPVRVTLEAVEGDWVAPVHAFAYDGRSFVVEQGGRVLDLDTGGVWLDISDRVMAGGERGLLGVDVHPSGTHVAAHYSGAEGATILTTYALGADGRPDVSSETVVLQVAQPASNHNGGSAVFGPDGMLWLALGDGGGGGDQYGNGQDPSTLLGALLRLDLHDPTRAVVPADNPFVDGGGAPEVWAYGLRNPYRIAFDATQVYIADVGQNAVEEVTVLPLSASGRNLGWNEVEGDRCFSDGCDLTAFEPADVSYLQAETGGCSIIGGLVYDGDAIPGLRGHFLYGDLCAGLLRTVRAVDGDVVDELDLTEQVGEVVGVTGIGEDAAGEPVLTFGDGRVMRLVPAG